MSNKVSKDEKAICNDNGLCSLTDEELAQVAGGIDPSSLLINPDYFPLGTFPPDLLHVKDLKLQVDPAVNVSQLGNFEIQDFAINKYR